MPLGHFLVELYGFSGSVASCASLPAAVLQPQQVENVGLSKGGSGLPGICTSFYSEGPDMGCMSTGIMTPLPSGDLQSELLVVALGSSLVAITSSAMSACNLDHMLAVVCSTRVCTVMSSCRYCTVVQLSCHPEHAAARLLCIRGVVAETYIWNDAPYKVLFIGDSDNQRGSCRLLCIESLWSAQAASQQARAHRRPALRVCPAAAGPLMAGSCSPP